MMSPTLLATLGKMRAHHIKYIHQKVTNSVLAKKTAHQNNQAIMLFITIQPSSAKPHIIWNNHYPRPPERSDGWPGAIRIELKIILTAYLSNHHHQLHQHNQLAITKPLVKGAYPALTSKSCATSNTNAHSR